jgi:hypothetical protein
VEVVTVVPPGQQARIADGGEGRRPGADDTVDVAAQQLQPRGVASLRALVVDPLDVAVVGDDEHRPPAGRQRGRRRDGERPRPVGGLGSARQGQPRRRRALAGRHPPQEGLARRVCRPRPGRRWGQPGQLRTGLGKGALGRRVPLGHGQAQDVAEDAAIPVGDGAGGGEQLGG